MVDFLGGVQVGKYTIHPMDPMGVIHRANRYCHPRCRWFGVCSSISNFRVIPPKSHSGKLRYEIHPDIVAGGLTQAFATYHLQEPVVQGFEVGSFQWSLQCYKL